MVTTNCSIKNFLSKQKNYFSTDVTKPWGFRLQQLKKLKSAIISRQDEILVALKADLEKPTFEGCFELMVVRDIDYAIKNLSKWVKPQSVKSDLALFPSSAKIYPEPLGIVLIISPWNYPFSLMISPLIGAIAAGNCAMLKPSELSPHTSTVLTKLIRDTFAPEYIYIQEGGVDVAQELLSLKFDHIFFTGGTKVGQIVM